MTYNFWQDKRVFLTGHTGFKGGWLSLWLQSLGAKVTGYALKPTSNPSLFEIANVASGMCSIFGDIRNLDSLQKAIKKTKPEIVIHMAAQPLVRYSYSNPVETYETNVMGSVNLLESIRHMEGVKVVVIVTSDKCYENREWVWGYRENESMGGFDPYSNSKACSELVTSAYRSSFFNPIDYNLHGVAVASVRAGNVIGGGDWADDRLIPDFFRSILAKRNIVIRNPMAIRPWQHVLEPLSGYLKLAEALFMRGQEYAQAWNFGPDDTQFMTVESILKQLILIWGAGNYEIRHLDNDPHESALLRLDSSKAKALLKWRPLWSVDQTIDSICRWYKAFYDGEDIRNFTINEINFYQNEKVNREK